MKKLIAVFCLVAMVLTTLVACDNHEHVFATDAWAKDADFHWRACTAADGCEEQGEKAEHEFEVVVNDEGKAVNQCKVCGETNDKVSSAPTHEHAYAEKFEKNENFHWYPCTTDGCYEMNGKAEHVYGNPEVTYSDSKITIKTVCVDCGYEKVKEEQVETEVDNAVSWDEMFKNFKLTNFTMDVYWEMGTEKQNNHCVVTDKEAYYCIPGHREFYTVTNEDGTCTTYQRISSDVKPFDEDEPFVKSADTTNSFLVGAQTETVIQVSFEEHFDKFTYDEETGSYTCEDAIEGVYYGFNGEPRGTIFCYNNVVHVMDGKISSISAGYYFDEGQQDEGMKASFKYSNIGTSVVEIPQNVINNAVSGQ